MLVPKQRILFWTFIGGLVALALFAAFWPRAVATDIATAKVAPMRTSINEEAETRVKDIYTLSAPITGHLRRIDLQVGDAVVEAKSIIAEIEPLDSAFLDPRSQAQAQAEINTAQSALDLAHAELKEAEIELEFAKSELDRVSSLRATGTTSVRDLDIAQRLYKRSRTAFTSAKAAIQMREFELERVKAFLMSPAQSQAQRASCDCLKILAPISGTVLDVITENEGVVQAGTPLVDIGDPAELEVVVELLSMDAVKVEPGNEVRIENWGGDGHLLATVRRIDPVGATKVSALGIEEQRVDVVMDFTSPKNEWARLGHGYQVDAAIVLWQHDEVLQVPLTALFRDGADWAIYAVQNGTVEKRKVTLGHTNTLSAELLSGLSEGEQYIVYPSDRIYEGVGVVTR